MSDLVTGEAVVLELRLAKVASRALAIAIDVAVQFTLLVVTSLLLAGLTGSVDPALAAAVSLLGVVSVLVVYPVAVETLTRGRSLGKLALGLRVVREDGGPVRFRQALIRGLLGVVEIWITFGTVALIASLASTQGKRLGDQLAGTVVIRERMPAQGGPLAAMPPVLAGWASELELSRLPDDLALAARQYLARARDLAPDVRESMGSRLAEAVREHVSPPPPPGVPAWAYLAAVLAERRRRELSRLQPAPGRGAQPQAWGPPPYGAPQPPPYGAREDPQGAVRDGASGSDGSRASAPQGDDPFAPPG